MIILHAKFSLSITNPSSEFVTQTSGAILHLCLVAVEKVDLSTD